MEFFRKTLDPVIALAASALLDIFLFLQLGAWTVGGGETGSSSPADGTWS